jgi:hypothetical protein
MSIPCSALGPVRLTFFQPEDLLRQEPLFHDDARSLALKRRDRYDVLVNSNLATIMTYPEMTDVTYIEPQNLERIGSEIEKEWPDAIKR